MADQADSDVQNVRWSDGGGFAVVPEWLLDAKVSDRAVRLYAVLGRMADRQLHAIRTRKEIAGRLRCSASTMDVAMKELRDLGAVTVKPRKTAAGDKAANDYTLHVTLPSARQGSTGDSVEGCTEPSGIRTRRTSTRDSGAKAPSLPAVVTREEPPPIRKVDGRNLPLDALLDECNIDAGNKRRVAMAATALNGRGNDQGIVHLFWLEAIRWCDEHEDDGALNELRGDPSRYAEGLVKQIRRKAAMYRNTMGGAHLTPTALRDWWLDLELKQQRNGAGMTLSDIEDL